MSTSRERERLNESGHAPRGSFARESESRERDTHTHAQIYSTYREHARVREREGGGASERAGGRTRESHIKTLRCTTTTMRGPMRAGCCRLRGAWAKGMTDDDGTDGHYASLTGSRALPGPEANLSSMPCPAGNRFRAGVLQHVWEAAIGGVGLGPGHVDDASTRSNQQAEQLESRLHAWRTALPTARGTDWGLRWRTHWHPGDTGHTGTQQHQQIF